MNYDWREEINNDFDINLDRYEIGTIINNNRDIVTTTNDLDIANNYYEASITKYSPFNNYNHVIIYLFDYDKNTNINYYDSEVD
jgi:hypothetical protein